MAKVFDPFEDTASFDNGTAELTPTDRSTQVGRPAFKLPSGDSISERTITVTDPRINNGLATNIPTVFDGKILSDEDAANLVIKSGGKDPITGAALPGFKSIDEAVSSAKSRSANMNTDIYDPFTQPAAANQEQDTLKEIHDYRDAGGGLANSLERGGRRILQSFAGMTAGIEDLAVKAIDEIGLGDTSIGKLAKDNAQYSRDVFQNQSDKIKSMPTHPSMTHAVEAANKTDSFIDAGKAFVGALHDSPDTANAIAEQFVELLPQVATFLVGAKGLDKVLPIMSSGLARQSTVMGGAGFFNSIANTYGSNLAEALEKGMTFEQSQARAALQSVTQGSVDALTSAVIPWKIGPNQWTNIPAQTLIQAAGGGIGEIARSASVGETAEKGDVAAEALLEVLGLPGDVISAIATRNQPVKAPVTIHDPVGKPKDVVADDNELVKQGKLPAILNVPEISDEYLADYAQPVGADAELGEVVPGVVPVNMAGEFTQDMPSEFPQQVNTEQVLADTMAKKSLEDQDSLNKLEQYFGNREKEQSVFNRIDKERALQKERELSAMQREQEEAQSALLDSRIEADKATPTLADAGAYTPYYSGRKQSDILSRDGKPFASEKQATFHLKAKKLKKHIPVEIDKGKWVVRPSNFHDGRLDSEGMRQLLKMKVTSDFTENGGVAYLHDEHGKVSGRTPSINPEWAQQALSSHNLSVKAVHRAVEKALAGEPLGARQASMVSAILDNHDEQNSMAGNSFGRKDTSKATNSEWSRIKDFMAKAKKHYNFEHDPIWAGYEPVFGDAYNAHEYEGLHGEARSVYELMHEAEEAGATEDEITAIAERTVSDEVVVAELFKLIKEKQDERRQTEKASDQGSISEVQRGHEDGPQADESRRAVAGSDIKTETGSDTGREEVAKNKVKPDAREPADAATKPKKDIPVSNVTDDPKQSESVDSKGTAPEHDAVGVDDRELEEIVNEFNEAQANSVESDEKIHHLFDSPAKSEIVRLNDKARIYHKDHGWMTPAQAKATIAEWKEHAQQQGENDDTRSANSKKVVLSLFDLTGKWSQPWEEAGYQVYRFDIQDGWGDIEHYGETINPGDIHNFSHEFFADMFGSFEGADVYAVLAACPCTDFASSGARHFATKDKDGRTVASVKLVHQTLATVEYFKPAIWAIENPVGRIGNLGGLPPWRLSFDPNHLGDTYTKKTLLWGRFNADLPIAPVEPTEGSKMHKKYGGKSMATKNARSATPEGFSYGFFMANNAIDNPVMAIANKYDRLDRGIIERAVKSGVTEKEIDAAVEDFYYQDLDDESANEAILDLIQNDNSIDAAAHEAATSPHNDLPQPTPAQKEAGNYKVGKITLHGLNISIENPKGSKRSGVDRGGNKWEIEMKSHYGYIRNTEGKDGDHVDVFLLDDAENADLPVFVIDQVDQKTRRFDEHKVVMGAASEQQAKDAYLANYEKGWNGIGSISRFSLADFKGWLNNGDTKKRASAHEIGEILDADRTLFHGTSNGNLFQSYDHGKANSGVGGNAFDQGDHFYLTSNREAAQWFANKSEDNRLLKSGSFPEDDSQGDVLEFTLKKGARVLKIDDMPRGKIQSKSLIDKARKDGYDAISFADKGFETIEGSEVVSRILKDSGLPETTIVINPDIVKAKSAKPAVESAETPLNLNSNSEKFAEFEERKGGSIFVKGDPDALVRYVEPFAGKVLKAKNGITLTKAKARYREMIPVTRETLASGAIVDTFEDDGVMITFQSIMTGIARDRANAEELFAEQYGPDKFKEVFNKQAPAKGVELYNEDQADNEARKKENERRKQEKVEAAEAAKKHEAEEKKRLKAEEIRLEAEKQKEWAETIGAGKSENYRYQAFLDTVEHPEDIKNNVEYMVWIPQRTSEFKAKHGDRPEVGRNTEAQRDYNDKLDSYIRQWADEHLSDRVKDKRVEDAAGKWDSWSAKQRTELLSRAYPVEARDTDIVERYRVRSWKSFNVGERRQLANVIELSERKRNDIKKNKSPEWENAVGESYIGSVDTAKEKVNSRNDVDEYRVGPDAALQRKAVQNAEELPNTKSTFVGLFAKHADFVKRLQNGEANLAEYRKAFDELADSREEVIAELSRETKDTLLSRMGGMMAHRYKSEKKDRVVISAYTDMLDDFLPPSSDGGMYSYSPRIGGDYIQNHIDAVREKVLLVTESKLEAYVERIAEARTERELELKSIKEGIENPQTLEDFQRYIIDKRGEGMAFNDARMTLSLEQRIKYDDLLAEKTRGERLSKKAEDRTRVSAADVQTNADIIETTHTRDGYDLFVVQAAERVDREVYNQWNATAKKLGGWYSSFKGRGATPGFQFKTREAAEAFQKYVSGGDTTAVREQAKLRRDAFEDDKSQSAVERLREMADRLDSKADEQLNRDRKTNTSRRASIAARAEYYASADKALASTMRNIAYGIEDGSVKYLDRVRQKVQVEFLIGTVNTAKNDEISAKYKNGYEREKHRDEPVTVETVDHAKWPTYTMYRSDWARLGRAMLEAKGLKQDGQQILKIADDISDTYLKFAKENLHKVTNYKFENGEIATFPTKSKAEESIVRSGFGGKAIVLPFKRGQNIIIISPSEARRVGVWEGDDDKRISLSPEFSNVIERVKGKVEIPWQLENTKEKLTRLRGIGIESPAEFRAMLREFIDLKESPAAPDKIKEMERAMIGRANDNLDFFPTPEGIADEMIEAADLKEGMSVLEPSAGMGHIAERVRQAGYEPDVIEYSSSRRELLQAKGFIVVGNDFMDMKPREFFTYGDVFKGQDGKEGILRGSGGLGSSRVRLMNDKGEPIGFYNREDLTPVRKSGLDSGYDRILMNPPFSDRRDMQHVQHAYDLLKPGGRLVAIVGEGIFFGSDKKAQAFRDWFDSVGGTDEKLPAGSFNDPKLPVNTSVNARMIVIDKSSADAPKLSRTGRVVDTGVKLIDLKEMIDQIIDNWENAPQVVSVQSVSELPSHLGSAVKESHAEGDTEGLFDPASGTVWLVADNIKDKASAQRVLFHEALGHYGLRQLLGDDITPLLNEVYLAYGRKGLRDIADRYQLDLDKRNDRLTAAEEKLAEIAEANEKPRLINKLIALVRNWLRKMGFTLELSDSDIREIVAKAGNAVRNRDYSTVTTDSMQPLFSRQKRIKDITEHGVKERAEELIHAAKRTLNAPKDKRKGLLSWMTERMIVDVYNPVFGGKQGALSQYSRKRQDMTAYLQDQLHNVDKVDAEWEKAAADKKAYKSLMDVMLDATYYETHPDQGGDYVPLVDMEETQEEVSMILAQIDKLRSMIRTTPGGTFLGDDYGDLSQRLKSIRRQLDYAFRQPKASRGNIGEQGKQLSAQIAAMQKIVNKPANKNIERMNDIKALNDKFEQLVRRMGMETEREKAFPDLIKRYHALPQQHKAVYQKVKQGYKDQWQALQKAIEDRLTSAIRNEKVKQEAIARIRQEFSQALSHGPYFPLARFGDYVVTAKDSEGRYVREHAETEYDWEKLQDLMKAEGYKDIRPFKMTDIAADDFKNAPAFAADIFRLMEENGVESTQLKDDIHQMVLKTMPELSYAKRAIHRRKTAGFSRDARRAFASTMFHGWNHISKIKFGFELQNSLDVMAKAIEDYKTGEESTVNRNNVSAAVDVYNHMLKRHEGIMNPKGSPWTAAAGNLGFLWYLGASPAAGIINLTQTALVAYPMLAAKFGHFKAMSALMGAAKDFAISPFKASSHESWKSLSRSLRISKEEREVIQRQIDNGTIDITQAHWIAQLADTDTRNRASGEMRTGTKKAMRYASALFHNAEVANREITLLAAYRLAKENGQADPEAYAQELTFDSHFDYSSQNRAQTMKNDFVKVATMMKNFSLHMIYTYFRRMIVATKGETKADRRLALRELVGITGMHFLAAGSLGMAPFIGEIFNVIDLALDDEDDPFDSKVEYKNWAYDTFGPTLGRALTEGVFNAAGVDIHSRVSIDELLLRSNDKDLEGRNAATYYLEQLAGPMFGMFSNGMHGLNLAANDGEVWRGLETAAPKFIKDPMKFARYQFEGGALTFKDEAVVDDLRADELFMQLMGFSPARINAKYDARNAIKGMEKKYQDRRQQLMNQYYQAVKARDAEAKSRAIDAVLAFNKANMDKPHVLILSSDFTRSMKSRARASVMTKDGTYLGRKAEPFREEGRFAE